MIFTQSYVLFQLKKHLPRSSIKYDNGINRVYYCITTTAWTGGRGLTFDCLIALYCKLLKKLFYCFSPSSASNVFSASYIICKPLGWYVEVYSYMYRRLCKCYVFYCVHIVMTVFVCLFKNTKRKCIYNKRTKNTNGYRFVSSLKHYHQTWVRKFGKQLGRMFMMILGVVKLVTHI